MKPVAWRVESRAGSVEELHRLSVPTPGGRRVVRCLPEAPALVLGSTQPDSVLDKNALMRSALDVVRRRSGGGAVHVVPGAMVWVNVHLGPNDVLWDDDVGRSAAWVGKSWAGALERIGVSDAKVSEEARRATSGLSRLACFGGIAPGEVEVGGRKIVGIAQRRNRDGCVFQCAALLTWSPERLAGLLLPPAGSSRELLASLAKAAVGLDELVGPSGIAGTSPAKAAVGLDELVGTAHAADFLWEEFCAALPP